MSRKRSARGTPNLIVLLGLVVAVGAGWIFREEIYRTLVPGARFVGRWQIDTTHEIDFEIAGFAQSHYRLEFSSDGKATITPMELAFADDQTGRKTIGGILRGTPLSREQVVDYRATHGELILGDRRHGYAFEAEGSLVVEWEAGIKVPYARRSPSEEKRER